MILSKPKKTEELSEEEQSYLVQYRNNCVKLNNGCYSDDLRWSNIINVWL